MPAPTTTAVAATAKKTTTGGADLKPDGKENEEKPALGGVQKVPAPDPSPGLDSGGMPRQRRISTGSSVSERSSFSQDMDSPRVGIDERLAYPAPYPSPMHRYVILIN